jgi:hypothetical protein
VDLGVATRSLNERSSLHANLFTRVEDAASALRVIPVGGNEFFLAAETQVTLLFEQARVVFSLDVSESATAIDPCSDEIFIDRLVNCTEQSFAALLHPIRFCNADGVFEVRCART